MGGEPFILQQGAFLDPADAEKTLMRISDSRAVFVGVEAYEVAGGTMLHDLSLGVRTAASWKTSPY